MVHSSTRACRSGWRASKRWAAASTCCAASASVRPTVAIGGSVKTALATVRWSTRLGRRPNSVSAKVLPPVSAAYSADSGLHHFSYSAA